MKTPAAGRSFLVFLYSTELRIAGWTKLLGKPISMWGNELGNFDARRMSLARNSQKILGKVRSSPGFPQRLKPRCKLSCYGTDKSMPLSKTAFFQQPLKPDSWPFVAD